LDHWAIIGWIGTAIFCASFLIPSRRWLHRVGALGAIVKLIYTWHYQLWPLMANWVILIVIELYGSFKRDDP